MQQASGRASVTSNAQLRDGADAATGTSMTTFHGQPAQRLDGNAIAQLELDRAFVGEHAHGDDGGRAPSAPTNACREPISSQRRFSFSASALCTIAQEAISSPWEWLRPGGFGSDKPL